MTDTNLNKTIHDIIQDGKRKAAIAQGLTQPSTPMNATSTDGQALMGDNETLMGAITTDNQVSTGAAACTSIGPTANTEPTTAGTTTTSTGTAPTTTADKPSMQKQGLALVPYCIVKSLSMLDNIYETRLFGWLIAKAQSVLKLYNKDLSEINVEHALGLTKVTIPARYILNEGDKNYNQITKSFSLATKKIEYEKNNIIYHLNIIAFPTLIKDGRKSLLSFVVHNDMWHALLDFSKGYRLFSLDTFMKLQSRYSVIMYLIITQQSEPKTYTVETLKSILGCTSKAYERGTNLFARVIDPARSELLEKAPWYFEYSAWKEGKRHKITTVTITPVLNKKYIVPAASEYQSTADKLRLTLDDKVAVYIIENFAMTAKDVEKIEPHLLRLGDSTQQLLFIAKIKERVSTGRVRNRAGYLVRSLQQANRA